MVTRNANQAPTAAMRMLLGLFLLGVPFLSASAENLTVNSSPTGAHIWYKYNGAASWADGGQNTNYPYTGLPTGTYQVKLVKSGYEDWISGVQTLNPGGSLTFSATLRGIGNITVNSSPSGAEIWASLNGGALGNTGVITPYTFANTDVGSWRVVLKKSGYADWEQTQTLSPGGNLTYSGTLQGIGNITVNSSPSGARIWASLNGGALADVGVDTPYTFSGVSAGSWRVVLKKSGYLDWEQTQSLAPGGSISYSGALPAQPGTISANSTPSGARIWAAYEGGAEGDTGSDSPYTFPNVSTGSWRVILKKPGYHSWQQTQVLPPGGAISFSGTLAAMQGTINVNSNPAGARIWASYEGGVLGDTGVATPYSFLNVSTGSWRVNLKLSGYADYEETQVLLPGATITYNPTLTSQTGTIIVNSNPPGAEFLYCQGTGCTPATSSLPSVTNITIPGVAAGVWRIKYRLNGYQDSQVYEQTLNAGQTITFNATLTEALPRTVWTGTMNLDGTLYQASLYKVQSAPGVGSIDKTLVLAVRAPSPSGKVLVQVSGGKNGAAGMSFGETTANTALLNMRLNLDAGTHVVWAEYRGSITPGSPAMFNPPLPTYGTIIPGYDTNDAAEWGHGEVEDAVAAVNFVKAGGLGSVPTSVYLIGGSHGGYIVLAVAHRVSGISRVVAVHGPATGAGMSDWIQNTPATEYPGAPGNSPRSVLDSALVGTNALEGGIWPSDRIAFIQRVFRSAGGEAEFVNNSPGCALFNSPPLSTNILLTTSIDDFIVPTTQSRPYYRRWRASYPGIKLMELAGTDVANPFTPLLHTHGSDLDRSAAQQYMDYGTIPAQYTGEVPATVQAKMTSSLTGAPLAGATLTISEQHVYCGSPGSASAVSGADGIVAPAPVSAGFTWVAASAPGYQSTAGEVYLSRGTNDYTASPLGLAPLRTQPQGALEAVAAGTASGWASDPDIPTASLTIHFYVDGPAGGGGTYIGAATAGQPTASHGSHGFSFSIPAQYRNGVNHTLYAYALDPVVIEDNKLLAGSPLTFNISVTGSVTATSDPAGAAIWHKYNGAADWADSLQVTPYTFSGLPTGTYQVRLVKVGYAPWESSVQTLTEGGALTFTPPSALQPAQQPVGNFDSADCTAIVGWTCDADDNSQPLTVHFYRDGPAGTGSYLGAATANISREPAVAALCGGNSSHGFSLPTPAVLKDGQPHSVYAYALNIGPEAPNPLLTGSPKTGLTCSGSSVPGDASISATVDGFPLTIVTTSRLAGAIHSLTWKGREFVNSYDHGRQLQSATSYDYQGECYNPTEAGGEYDGTGATSTSQLQSITASANVLATESRMAFWLAPGTPRTTAPGYCPDGHAVNATSLSDHLVRKTVTIGFQGMPNVIEYLTEFTVPETHAYGQFEALTGYMPPDFTKFWKYDPATQSLTVLSDGPGEQSVPIIFSTEDGLHAMGIYSPDLPQAQFPGAGYGRFRYDYLSPTESKTNKWNTVFRRASTPAGTYSFRTYPIVGTLQKVQDVMTQLHLHFYGGSVSVNSSPAGARIWYKYNGAAEWADSGAVTPYSFASLPAGTYQVKLVLSGYADWTSAQQTLAAGGSLTFSGTLQQALPPVGNLDAMTCSVITGWACDADNYSQALSVHLYKDGPAGAGTYLGEWTANLTREAAVAAQCGGNSAHGFSIPTPAALKDGQQHSVHAYAINIGGVADNPLLTGSPLNVTCTQVTPDPSLAHIKHFGYYVFPDNPLIETNLAQLNGLEAVSAVMLGTTTLESRLNLAAAAGKKAGIDLSGIFYYLDPAASDPGGLNFPANHDADLRPDYESRWNAFVAANHLTNYSDQIAFFYLVDEPYWNNLQYADLHAAAWLVKRTFPTVPISFIEAYTVLEDAVHDHLAIPPVIDWVGFDKYGVIHPASDPLYLSDLAKLKGKLSGPKQRLAIIGDAFYSDGIHGIASPPVAQTDLAAIFQEQVSIARSEPKVKAFINFLWNDNDGVEGHFTGSVSLPQAARDAHFAFGNTLKANDPGDSTPPSASLTAPAPGATISYGSSVGMQASASDASGMGGVEFYIDGEYKGSALNAPYSLNIAANTLSEGQHTLEAIAYDAAGNNRLAAPVTVNIVATTTGTISGYKIDQNGANFNTPGATLSIIGMADIGAAVNPYSVTVTAGNVTVNSSVPSGYSVSYSACAGCTDHPAASYVSGSVANVSVTPGNYVDLWWKYTPAPDTLSPSVTLSSPANGATISGLVTVSASASDDISVSRVEFSADGVLRQTDYDAPYSFPLTTSQLTNGAHTLRATAYDVAGNSAYSQVSVTVNNAVTDTTPPSDVPAVYDGTGADIEYSLSSSQLSANWPAAADLESGIQRYYYAVGTSPGASDTVAWTDNGALRYVTRFGLSLGNGAIYYFSVKAENGVGLQSAAVPSNGQRVDTTAPAAVSAVADGAGADAAYSTSGSELSANWTASSDPQSGIAGYSYAIGTAQGNTDVLGWTDTAGLTATRSGLALASGTTYYFSVRARNNAGLTSSAASSNGVLVDTSPPSSPALVRDGTGEDLTYTYSTSELSANWTASADPHSGVAAYYYAIGTSPGASDTVGWSSNGTATSVTRSGLTLADGGRYYFSVKAQNAAGLQSPSASSNGIYIQSSRPTAVAWVNDGTGEDQDYAPSVSQLSSNWGTADHPSGITRYLYGIGTMPGLTDIASWTDNGTSRSVTRSGLSLANGTSYYFTVKAENALGQQGDPSHSNGQLADGTPPSAVPLVNDGTGADSDYAASLSQLSANWTASADAESGILRYWYAIGTSPGAADAVSWTDNSTRTYVTRTGLALSNAANYYFTVKAENRAGLQSSPSNSDGQFTDDTPPSDIPYVDDGTGADGDYSTSLTQLSANWGASADAQSGLAAYMYAIGTYRGGADVTGWTDNGLAASVTRAGLSLANGTVYYVSARSRNNSGLLSAAASSDGQRVDATAPSAPAEVRDGAGADIAYTNSLTELSANWTAAADPESGVASYWYAIGTSPGASDVAAWTDGGAILSVSRTGLVLSDGTTYYFAVKAQNAAGLESAPAVSDGQLADAGRPSKIVSVNDGYGEDADFNDSITSLSANWSPSYHPDGIARYWYAIGTSSHAADVLDWTDNALDTRFARSGMSLTNGQRYFVLVKSETPAGRQSAVSASDGQRVDNTPPDPVAEVLDGAGTLDADYSSSLSQLSAAWLPVTDPESGVAAYWYSIGTMPGGTDIAGWSYNGISTYAVRTGLSLANGARYYFSVRALNNAGLFSPVTYSDGQRVDSTPPSAITSVTDGTGASDIDYATSLTQLSASWPTSEDSDSGLAAYYYSIGTSAGGTQVLDWTENALSTSVTRTGLSLSDGGSYFFNVKAVNNAGLATAVASSDGQQVEVTPPAAIAAVNDGTGADQAYAASLAQLSANWTPSSDPQTGVARYWYAIGTSPGASDAVPWTDNGGATSVTSAGLTLSNGAVYYFSVKAQNGAGLYSGTSYSDGQRADVTPPSAIAWINDGTGADADITNYTDRLSANWAPSSDLESGVTYYYAIGTSAGGTDVSAWTLNSTHTSVTRTGLTLANGTRYYFAVKAVNGAGVWTGETDSNGQLVDTTKPDSIAQVNDGPEEDTDYAASLTQLSANWTASAHPDGIEGYYFAIGTSRGGTEVLGWTANGPQTSVTRTGLALENGRTYYFAVKARSNTGLQSEAASSDGQTTDITPPAVVPYVNDGTGPDLAYASSLTRLSANWGGSSDAESGVTRYWFAAGTAPGASDLSAWTDNSTRTYVTISGLSLSANATYYFTVKAENAAGLLSPPASSDGQRIDSTPPAICTLVNDGELYDVAYTGSISQLSANWSVSSDVQTGVARYWYAVGTYAGGTNVVPWTDNGTAPFVTRTGLALSNGGIYYFSVKAENGVGLVSSVTSSDGQRVDNTPPSEIPFVYDGAGSDIAYSPSPSELTANWGASSDPQSGLRRYLYAIGSAPGLADIVPWTNNGTYRNVLRTSLSLSGGTTYYVGVKAESNAGLLSGAVYSDGQTVDLTPPPAPAWVRDGTGDDREYYTSASELYANWPAVSDPESGISGYFYAIGTSPGLTDVRGWTGIGVSTYAALTSLSLANGSYYYLSVKARNGAGLESAAVNSNGVLVDTDRPSEIAEVLDGTGADEDYAASTVSLSANWTPSAHPSGIASYYYAIGTSPGAADILDWTDNGPATSVTRSALSLPNGTRAYFSVKAQNNIGRQSGVTSSNGQTADVTPPAAPGILNDGPAQDQDYTPSASALKANWGPFADAESGVARYFYAIGTAPGALDVVPWTDADQLTYADLSGLALAENSTYYFSVKAVNGAGLPSQISVSDGVMVDLSSPTAAATLLNSQPLRSGPFTVQFSLSENGALAGAPSLAFTTSDGRTHPLTVGLPEGGTWTASGYIDSTFPSGAGIFRFSASDLAGNSGTLITSGGGFTLDTLLSGGTGGTFSNSDGSTAVIPPGVYPAGIRVHITTAAVPAAADASSPDSVPVLAYDLAREFRAYDNFGAQVSTFTPSVIVRLSYPDSNNDGVLDGTDIPESALGLYWLDEVAVRWVPMTNGLLKDTFANTIEAAVTHFSVYAIRALPVAALSMSTIRAYPSPCYLKKGSLYFGGIPSDAAGVRIYIYTPAGDLVRKLEAGDGIAPSNLGAWDGRNDSGEKAASGVYIYLVKTANKGSAGGKFAVLW